MRDLPRDLRTPAEVAWLRIAESDDPVKFQTVLGRASAALTAGSDMATAAWTVDDPVKIAAEIEALAAARRLTSCRKDPK